MANQCEILLRKTFLKLKIAIFWAKNNRIPMAASELSWIIKFKKPFILANLNSFDDIEGLLFAVKLLV